MAIYREQLHFLKRISSRVNSAVYLCQEKKSKDLVVFKQTLLSPRSRAEHGDDPWREHEVAQLLFSLGGHPHLLNCRSARIENNASFLLMDFCEQGDLYSYLEAQEERKLEEPIARHIFRQIALGVQFLHQHGVAHRDISLENVLLDDKFIAKLCDFGLSASFPKAKGVGADETSNTDYRVVGRVGKAYYMAPEVVADKEYNPILADIWSLGILLFILLTGSPLFDAATPEDPAFAAVQKVGIRGVLKHWKLDDEISSATIDLLTRMLQFDPERRFQSVMEILDAHASRSDSSHSHTLLQELKTFVFLLPTLPSSLYDGHCCRSSSTSHCIQPEADAEFSAEAERYHLYVAYSCPFASRALAARNLKGLEDVVSISVVRPVSQKTKPDDPSDGHKGWTFVDPAKEPTLIGANGNEYSTEGCIPHTVLNARFVRDIYELVDKTPRAYLVPLLWDKKKHTIVTNESADIPRTFNSGFRELVSSQVDLLPDALLEQIEKISTGVVDSIGSDMFKVIATKDGESRAQQLANLFANIQTADDILAKTRFLMGDAITETDIRLFHTLIRFDVYQLEGDKFHLSQYPNVLNYLRDLCQMPTLKKTVHWDHLKFVLVNFTPNVVPVGPFVDYEGVHDRATRFAK